MTIAVYNKTILTAKQDLGLYSGDIAFVPEEFKGHPRLNWSGSIIDIDQFRIALSFLKWTYDAHHVEGQVRLFYNEFTREWKAVALPQYIGTAAHTDEVEENDPIKSDIIADLLNSGFGQAATGHHHSGMNAFQSGGDKKDELGQNGFHFTVGHMGAKIADFNCRATFRKINYDPNQDMLDPNQWLPGLHNKRIQDEEIAYLWLNLTDLPLFPEVWKTYLRKKPEPVAHQWRGGYGHQSNFGFAGHLVDNSTTKPNETKIEMFRDGWVCIFFKPSNPPVNFQLRITPKMRASTNRQPATAASITTPIPPAPTQAEINQKKLEELEAAKQKDTISYTELVDRVSAMTQLEYDDFCQNLRDAALKHALTKLPANDLSTPRGRVIERLEECLAEFRDTFVPDRGNARDIKNIYDALQDASWRIIRVLEMSISTHIQYLRPLLTPVQLQEILIAWGGTLFTDILAQTSPEEWTATVEECNKPIYQAVNFCDTMQIGLKKAIARNLIDPVYDKDGVSVPYDPADSD